MISLNYVCRCGWKSGILDSAQAHANATSHTVSVQGTITSNKPDEPVLTTIADRAKNTAREAAILRAARDRGLL